MNLRPGSQTAGWIKAYTHNEATQIAANNQSIPVSCSSQRERFIPIVAVASGVEMYETEIGYV